MVAKKVKGEATVRPTLTAAPSPNTPPRKPLLTLPRTLPSPLLWATFLSAVLLAALPAAAQSLPEPVDPLKRPASTPGRLTLGVSLGYAPTSGVLFDVDEGGNPYTDTYALHTLIPDLSLKYALSDRLSLGAGLTARYRIEQTLRRYAPDDTRYLESGSLVFLPRASLAYRIAPESPLDPSVVLSLYKPWAADVSLSASLIRDPIVLSSSFAFAHGFIPPYPSSFSLAAGAGFVANDRISFGLSTTLTQPLVFAASPNLSLGLSTSYGLDPEGSQQLTVSLNASVTGGALAYGINLGYELRELDPKTWVVAALGR